MKVCPHWDMVRKESLEIIIKAYFFSWQSKADQDQGYCQWGSYRSSYQRTQGGEWEAEGEDEVWRCWRAGAEGHGREGGDDQGGAAEKNQSG